MKDRIDTVINSIAEFCDLNILRFSLDSEGAEYFYLLEQSSLQVLRELPIDTQIKVVEIFSERHRFFQKIEVIKSTSSIKEFFQIVLPLVENGNFDCSHLRIIIEGQINLLSHDDGEVHLVSSNASMLHGLILKVLKQQGFGEKLLDDIISKPNLYHKIEKPDLILCSFETFEEVIESM